MNVTLPRTGLTMARPVVKNLALLVLMSLTLVVCAHAGTNDTEFQQLFNKVLAWTGGYAGKTAAIVALGFGTLAGIARGTMVPALVGLGFALLLSFGPGVITGLVTATI